MLDRSKLERNKYQPYVLTPKLEQLIADLGEGQPVHEKILGYAERGYQTAVLTLIMTAECGDAVSKSLLPRMVVNEENLSAEELKRAFEACDLDAELKTNLLTIKAQKGTPWALELLKKQYPPSRDFVDAAADEAEDALLAKVAESQGHWTATKIRSDLRNLERDLVAAGDSAIERILARRIVICHLTLLYCETVYFKALENERAYVNHSDIHLKRMHQAHERYLAAVKSLAQVRKMKLPNVQVNIGEKQVNIA